MKDYCTKHMMSISNGNGIRQWDVRVGSSVKIEPNTRRSKSQFGVGKDEGQQEGGRRKGCDGGRRGYKAETNAHIDETKLR